MQPNSLATSEFKKTIIPKKSRQSKSFLYTDTKFILDAIENFKQGDDMLTLNTLYNLSSELSIANDTLADDINCPILIGELINLFDKFFLPDITLYSLQCINYLLDLNPAYTATVKKFGGMNKIVLMTQNIEFIDLAESAIKAIEKMSLENAFALLECDAFSSVLNLIDFFELGLKKAAVRACVNMSVSCTSIELFTKYIVPAVPSLTNLTKINENDQAMTSNSLTCFFYLTSNMKSYFNESSRVLSILQFGLVENLFEMIYAFLKEDKRVSADMFRNILKILNLLANISNEATDSILNMNILEIIHQVLAKELSTNITLSSGNEFSTKSSQEQIRSRTFSEENNANNANNNNINKTVKSNTASFLSEIFSLLMGLFPPFNSKKFDKSDKIFCKADKILNANNKTFYEFFSEKILTLLIENILNISSCSTLLQVVKLLNVYTYFSSYSHIIAYLQGDKISHIIGKLLDTKETFYLEEVLVLLENLMHKAGANFIIYFLREGIVDILNSFDLGLDKYTKNNINVESKTNNTNNTSNILYSNKELIYNEYNYTDDYNNEEDEINEEKYMDEHGEYEYNEYISGDEFLKYSNEIEDNLGLILPGEEGHLNEIKDNNKEKLIDTTNLKTFSKRSKSKDKSDNNITNTNTTGNAQNTVEASTNKEDQPKSLHSPKSKLLTNKDAFLNKEQMVFSEFLEAKKNATLYDNSKFANNELNNLYALDEKLKKIQSEFFTQEKIKQILNETSNEDNPLFIFNSLEAIKKEISENRSQEHIKKAVDILSDKQKKLTLWEIEKSEILLAIADFIDPNFSLLLQKKKTEEEKNPKNNFTYLVPNNKTKKLSLSLPYKDYQPFEKIKFFLQCFDNDINKIFEFLRLIQYTITSMNCFVVYFSEASSYNPNVYRQPYKVNYAEPKVYYAKFIYNEKKYEVSSKNFEDLQVNFEKITSYHEVFKQKKEIKLSIISSDTFEIFERMLMNETYKFGGKKTETLPISRQDHNNNNTSLNTLQFINPFTLYNSANNNVSTKENIQTKITFKINFFLEAEVDGIINVIKINKSWKIKDLRNEVKNNPSFKKYSSKNKDLPIFFEIDIQACSSDLYTNLENALNLENGNKIFSTDDKIISETNIDIDIEKNIPQHDSVICENDDILVENKIDYSKTEEENYFNLYERILFEKVYKVQVITNPDLYEITRLAPSLFLLAILNMTVTSYSSLFGLKDIPVDTISQFENLKVTNLLFKSLKDYNSIASGSIPHWCKNLARSFPFLMSFNSRFLLFKTLSFDPTRGIINLQNYMRNFSGETNTIAGLTNNLAKNKRLKILVDRNDIISSALKIMKENANFIGFLEFEYLNETGTGLGPTLEFYSLVINELRQNKNLWYKTTDQSLFPAPNLKGESIQMFTLLGFLIARGLYDDRLIDLPLHSVFWDLLLDKGISFSALKKIDINLGTSILNDFTQLIRSKHLFLKSHPEYVNQEDYDLGEEIKYNKMRVDEVGILFNLPGYPEIELKEEGLETLLTIHNIEEYTEGIFETLFGKGLRSVKEAFKSGFNLVFDIENLKEFYSKEIEETLCGSLDDHWDYEMLFNCVKPDHGYDRNSQIYNFLLRFMTELPKDFKKKFLTFVTGSPRLPIGGFKSLTPNLTVVKKTTTSNLESPDDFLPTVMTCQNYLKIPDYSSYEVFSERFFTAINEGSNAFLLS